MAVVTTSPLPPPRFPLASGAIASHPFAVEETRETLVRFAHNALFASQQDLTIVVWVSETPNGQCLQTIPMALRRIHPKRNVPFTYGFQAATSHPTLTPAPLPESCNPFVVFDSPICRIDTPRLSVFTARRGVHFVNFHNLTNRENLYTLEIFENQTPICSAPVQVSTNS